MAIAIFFIGHWISSVFFQTFFLHRYGAHRMFSMSPFWERAFHLGTFIAQGSSYLDPRGYAILHREHHAFSDTARDPHSPRNFGNAFTMMWQTKERYDDYAYGRREPEARFAGGVPRWSALDRLAQNWGVRLAWVGLYVAFYLTFATAWWQYLLLPVHFVMGPIHGAIVNWCGHKYGYRNHETSDDSRNTLPFDILTMGELFQNNHHKFSMRPNFATQRWEIDPTYWIMRGLARLGVIELVKRTDRTTSPVDDPEPVRRAA